MERVDGSELVLERVDSKACHYGYKMFFREIDLIV